MHAGDHIAVVGWFVGDRIEEWIAPRADSLENLRGTSATYGIDVGDEQLQSVLQNICQRATAA